MTIGEKMRNIRKEKGLTQKQLGDRCNMADSAIRRYESNRGNPTMETIYRIADALEVDPRELMDSETATNYSNFVENTLKSMGFESDILTAFRKLNIDGQQKAVERVEELTEIPKYQKEPIKE